MSGQNGNMPNGWRGAILTRARAAGYRQSNQGWIRAGVLKMKPLYKVTIDRCADGTSFDVEIAKLGAYAIAPGRWLKNRTMAQGWIARQVSYEVWATMRRWRKQRPYLV